MRAAEDILSYVWDARVLGSSQRCVVVFEIGQVVSSVNASREAANLLDLDRTHCVIPPPALPDWTDFRANQLHSMDGGDMSAAVKP